MGDDAKWFQEVGVLRDDDGTPPISGCVRMGSLLQASATKTRTLGDNETALDKQEMSDAWQFAKNAVAVDAGDTAASVNID